MGMTEELPTVRLLVTERPATRGWVQAVVWDADMERWLLDDPPRVFHPHQYRRHVRSIHRWRSNKIVANTVAGFGNGLNLMRDWIAAEVPPPPTHVAWGANGTAPQISDVGLFDEKVRTDIIARAKGDKQVIIGGFMGSTTGNGFTYQEAALVTGPLASQWRLFARVAINPIVKSTSVIISVSWQVDLA